MYIQINIFTHTYIYTHTQIYIYMYAQNPHKCVLKSMPHVYLFGAAQMG